MAKKSIHYPSSYKISWWLRDAAEQLASVGITTALLDAEIILAHTLRKSRTFLHAHGDEEMTPREYEIANARLDLRCDRTPIAYIVGHKEFYGRLFKVTPSVLVPRPESEAVIELFLAHGGMSGRLIDVGTGSGCLGITAKLERPDFDVTLSDTNKHALHVAKQNAQALEAQVDMLQSDLLQQVPFVYDCMLANLPYVDHEWERSPETNYEPELALFAGKNGVALIFQLIEQCSNKLAQNGWLFLEADPYQHERIITYAGNRNLIHTVTLGYSLAFKKIS